MLIKGLLLALCMLRWNLEHFAHLHWRTCTKILIVDFGIVPKVWCFFVCLFFFSLSQHLDHLQQLDNLEHSTHLYGQLTTIGQFTTFGPFTTIWSFTTFELPVLTIFRPFTTFELLTIFGQFTTFELVTPFGQCIACF